MATGVGMSFDLDAALRNAEKLDKKLSDMVASASKLEQTMTNAFRAGGATEILSRLQQRLAEVGKTKVDVHFETKKAEEMYSIMDRIVGTMTTLSQGGKVELFDTKKVYETADSMLLVEHRLAETQVQIEALRKKWNEILLQDFDESNFSAPINKQTGKAYGKNTKTYENALNLAKQQFAETQEFNRMLIEERLKVLIETEAIQKKELQWASMTEDQKAQYVQKRLNEVLKAEQKHTSEVQKEYSKLSAEIIRIYDQIQRTEKSVAKGEKTGVDVSKEKGQLTTLETKLREKLARQQQIEQESGNLILQQIEDFWVKVQERDRKGLEDRIKAQQEAKKREEEEWQRYIRTPEGAIGISESAKSINDEREAIKLLIAARDNLSKSTANYQQIIDDLNNRIQKHRISVEQLTTAEKNEQTLQPTIRNEYARLLKELDQLAEAKKRLYMTDAYKSNDADANRALNDIMAREQDVQNKIAEIRKNAQGLLDETERKHAADRANNEIAEIERVERKRQEYAKLYTGLSPMQAQSLVTAGQGTQAIANEERAIQRLVEQKYALDKQDQNYVQTINRLDDEIAEHKRNIQALTEAERERVEQQKKQNQTFAGAIAFSNSAKTLEQERQAVKNLEAAREKLDKTDVNYQKDLNELNSRIKQHNKNIQEATAGAKDLQKKHRGLMDTSGQLARAMATVFSVSAIKGYVNKLMQIRGEFELQQRSLQVLLQNKDEANALWDKTVALAVKSPYTTKQLVTATKQLAAYRVESEKLYETNKMLADVSIGLGVDMNRLILAFGQVKAANFLRGTELRQFSEAGVNMLDELAKRFTALEGRAVSVGEVFERVSKRMVSFADVEAVFKTITSEGGTFYQMQEKQSETLKGMMLNLKDSYELMLNDIGKENEGRLKGFVSTMRFLVDNWRELAFILEKVVVSYASFKAVNAIYVLGMKRAATSTTFMNNSLKANLVLLKSKIASTFADIRAMTLQEAKTKAAAYAQMLWAKTTNALKVAMLGLGAAIKMAIPFALVGIALELWRVLTKASREAERLRKELNNIVSGDVADLDKAIDRYTNLATRLDKVNKGSDAHREIISKLNSEYGEYLNFVVTEETTMQNLADAYENVVKVMKEKQALASFEKGMNAISQSYGNALTDAKEDFYDLFEGASIKSKTDKFKFLVPTEKEIDDIYAIIQQRAKELDAYQFDSLKEQSDLIQEVVSGYYGGEFFLSRDFSQSIELLDILVKRKEQEKELQEEINAIYKEVLHSREAQLELEKLQNEYAEKRRKIESVLSGYEKEKALAELADEQELAVIDLKLRFNLIEEPEATKQKDAIINWAKGTIADINNRLKNELSPIFSEEELSKVLFTRHIKDSKTINDYLKDITNNWKQQNEIIAEQISLKSELGSLDETNENILQTALRKEELYRRTAELLGVELKYTERLSEETRNAINAILPEEYQISLEQAYGGIDKIIADLKKEEAQHLNIIEQINERKKEGLPFNEQELKDAEDAYWWTKKRLDLIDPKTKSPISEGKVNTINAKLEEKYQIDAVDRTKDEVTLLSEANSEKEKAIAYEKQLNAQKEQGHNITEEELDAAKKDVEQYTLLWKLLGGTEKETTGGKGRSNSLYDERIKVIDDLNKKYRELSKTLDESTSLQGAFDAYIDAFADAYEGISWIPKNVRQMSAEEFVEKVLNFPNEDALVEFLDRLANEPMKTFEKIKVELAKGEYVMDMRVEMQQKNDKAFQDQIEQMFSGYELSLELEKLNIPRELAESLFGVDTFDLSDIRTKLEQELYRLLVAGGYEDQIKKIQEFLKKVSKLEQEEQEERLKRYAKFLTKGFNERINLKIKELRELELLEKDKEKLAPQQYEAAKKGIQSEYNTKILKQEWEEFEKSSQYLNLFDDIENSSNAALRSMLSHLESLKQSMIAAGLPASDLKDILNQIEKVEEELEERTPFATFGKDLGTAVGKISEYIQARKEEKKLLEKIDNLRQKEKELSPQVAEEQDNAKNNPLYQTLLAAQKHLATLEEGTHEYEVQEKAVEALYNAVYPVTTEHQEITEQIDETNQELDDAQSKTKKWKESLKGVGNGIVDFGNDLKEVGSFVSDMAQKWEQAFGLSDRAKDDMETIAGVAQSAGDMAVGIGKAIANPADIGAYMQAASGLMGVFATFGQAHDKDKERQIEREMKLVERLQKVYEDLGDTIKNAYSIDTLNEATQMSRENIMAQIEATNRMIEAEEGKKDTDWERIEDWKEDIEELKEAMKELEETRLQELGAFASDENKKSGAEAFLDAWMEAYKQTGDGLSGLNEQFDEFFEDMIKKQLLQRGSNKYLEGFFSFFDEKIAENAEKTPQEMAAALNDIMDYWNNTKGGYNEMLKQLAEKLGVAESLAGKDAELSGLQAGIQGITEDQADVLASYWNSVRGYNADTNAKVTELVTKLFSDDTTTNPMLSQLLTIAEQTRAIRDLFESVIGRGGNNKHGGAYLKVDIG